MLFGMLAAKTSLYEASSLHRDILSALPIIRCRKQQNNRVKRGRFTQRVSGNFVNLLQTDAFMELPLEKNEFKKGETYRIWTFI